MKKLLIIAFILLSFTGNSQDLKDDVMHFSGNMGLTAITYSIPRNLIKLPFYISAPISFGLNELLGQIIENSDWNHYDKKDLRINRYGTLAGVLTFELFNQKNRAADLELKILEVNKKLITMNKEKQKFISLEFNKSNK